MEALPIGDENTEYVKRREVDMDKYEATYNDDPLRWMSNMLLTFNWSKQVEIINSVFNYPKTVVRACHAPGKTFTAAEIVLAFLYLRSPAKVITTAPTWLQVKDLLWSEINKLWVSCEADTKLPGRILQTRLEVTPDWFATGLSPRVAVNMQGFHQANILIVFDEAPGVRPELVDAAESLMSTGNPHMLWIGNPISQSGFFYEAFTSPKWHKIHISAFDTPNFTGEEVPDYVRRLLISKQWVEDRKDEWGEDSPVYQSKVLGDFPDEDPWQIISLGLCEASVLREIEPTHKKELGVDVARFGDDNTVLAVKDGDIITELIIISGRDTVQVSRQIMALHNTHNFLRIKVDEIGVGAGVVDTLKAAGLPVAGVNVARKSTNELYKNLRTQLWFDGRDWLGYGKIPNDDRLKAELTAPRYDYTPDGKYMVEKKDETKKRIGRSPDCADAVLLAIYNPAPAHKSELYIIG